MTTDQSLYDRIAKARDEVASRTADLEGRIRELSERLKALRSDRKRLDRLLSQAESLESEGGH